MFMFPLKNLARKELNTGDDDDDGDMAKIYYHSYI